MRRFSQQAEGKSEFEVALVPREDDAQTSHTAQGIEDETSYCTNRQPVDSRIKAGKIKRQAPESQPAGAEPSPVYSAPVVPRKEASRSIDGVPLYLKLTEKKTPKLSSLILSIPLSTIDTFFFQVLAIVPRPVRGNLISQVFGLDFKLNENNTALIPLHTKEHPMQGKTLSGAVLDNVREISQMTSFSVYIDHTASHEADLNSIRNAINEGRLRFTRKRQLDLQSLYQGQGAQIALFPPQLDKQPAYDDVPSSSLDITTQKRKRPRRELNDHESETSPSGAETLKELSQRMAAFELWKTP
ncbi:hypothetical protein F25303_13085 [Fusarium sp. NRRL 25303]|nr:hypothetical protein F25303_13085 [Fusarium sp. NRRL 25303]